MACQDVRISPALSHLQAAQTRAPSTVLGGWKRATAVLTMPSAKAVGTNSCAYAVLDESVKLAKVFSGAGSSKSGHGPDSLTTLGERECLCAAMHITQAGLPVSRYFNAPGIRSASVWQTAVSYSVHLTPFAESCSERLRSVIEDEDGHVVYTVSAM